MGGANGAGGMDYILTPTAIQQKLSIRKFDGTELCRGLGSGFFDSYVFARDQARRVVIRLPLVGRREG